MAPPRPWAARMRLLLVLPGGFLAIGLLERVVFQPLYAERSADANIEYWERFTERHPEFPEGFVTLGQICQEAGDARCAGAAYARALEASPSLGSDIIRRTATLRSERGSEELRVLAVLFAEHPACTACGSRLVNGLRLPGSRSPPLDVVARLVALGPEPFERAAGPPGRARFLLFSARLRAQAGEPSAALELYDQVAEYDPDLIEVHLHRGLLLASRDAPAAVRELEAYRSERPDDVRATIGLALALLNAGAPARARELLLPMLQERPDLEPARQLLERADAELAATRLQP